MQTSNRRQLGAASSLVLVAIVAALIVVIIIVSPARQDEPPTDRIELGRPSAAVDDITRTAQQSLITYWTGELPTTYQRTFIELAGGFQPKTPESEPFSCSGQRQTYQDLRGNAFYCPADDFIAWDAAGLFPQLANQFGSIAPAIVLAHEVGHAIQARAAVQARSVVIELQADCFAGSWIRFAETSQDDPVVITDGALDSAVATVLVLRDQPGTTAAAAQAHGLGFDRVNAFQTGYEQGAGRCASFPSEGVVTTELPFRTEAEAQSGGNLPFAQTVQVLSGNLDTFWATAVRRIAAGRSFSSPTLRPVQADRLPECPGDQDPEDERLVEYCAATSTVDLLTTQLAALHARIGDLATGAALSDAWGQAAQAQAGLPTTGQRAGLQRDCFTGAWIASLAAGDLASSPLSPGDLDEALTAIIASTFTDDGRRMDRGGAFGRTKSLRTGVFEGLTACI
ncbi:neutral zinc metallopeptidase [Kribbella caucasensis]|nr:neutral zinc metallopeptidase [Kribbella sp. VKM Ac-2527]